MSDDLMINLVAQVEPWFTNAGLVGGLIGGGIGILGAVYGTAVGVLAPRGKGRPFVFALHWAALALGGVFLVAGVTAVITGQPYGVWYSLLLPGLLLTILMGTMTPAIKLRYRQAEHRRLAGEEFRRG